MALVNRNLVLSWLNLVQKNVSNAMPININGSSSYAPSASTRDSVSTGFERVSSGQRINNASDDAAGVAIVSRISTEIEGLSVASRNAADAISLTQVADGALSSVSDNIARIRELALSAANGTLNDQDRQALAAEAEQLTEENSQILEGSSFNGASLFDNQNERSFQVGPNAEDTLTTPANDLASALEALGLEDIDISTQEGASNALSVLDEAEQAVSSQASEFGALSNRLESSIDNIERTRINETEARSRIEDADLAEELANISAGLVREQVGIAVQAQANTSESAVLKLLQ